MIVWWNLLSLPTKWCCRTGSPASQKACQAFRASGADRPLLRGGEVPRHRIEPDVEPLRVVPVERDRDPPVEVAGNRRRMEALLQEVLRNAQRARAPMPLVDEVLGELSLQLIELEVEVLGGPELGGRAAESALRASQLARLERTTTTVALVTAGVLEATVRAGADESTGPEGSGGAGDSRRLRPSAWR